MGLKGMAVAEVKGDCFAYKKTQAGGKCTALKELYCKKEQCGFYKKREVQDDKPLSKEM